VTSLVMDPWRKVNCLKSYDCGQALLAINKGTWGDQRMPFWFQQMMKYSSYEM